MLVDRVSESKKRLVPRSLGISSPPGKDVYEFYLALKYDPMILGRISDIFSQKRASILSAHLQLSVTDKRAYAIFYIEMNQATADIPEMLELLNQDHSVIESTAASRNQNFFESNMFPPTSGGHYRVFIMGAESWINLVRSFKQRFGTPADSILYSQGLSAGLEMAAGIEARIGANVKEPEPKLRNLKGLFWATGLGILEISGHRESFHVTISDSMGAKTDLVDNFLIGIASGALGRLFSKEYTVSELRHNIVGGVVTLTLT